jgi:S1-C subfamily serine protease
MFRKIPDWLFYAFIVGLIYFNASRLSEDVSAPPPPPLELGPLLPSESPRDDIIITEIDVPQSGTGTAFAIDQNGNWLTARHVVDSCSEVALKIGTNRIISAEYEVFEENDLAVLRTNWTRKPLPNDVFERRQVGENGYFIGFPQGRPGEVVGSLISRSRMIVRGRYTAQESVLAWAELGRTQGLRGSLGGLSGAPVLDKDGEIIGLVTAENPRRGRIYSVAPGALRPFFSDTSGQAEPIDSQSYGLQADRLRRDRRIAQVLCLVEGPQ